MRALVASLAVVVATAIPSLDGCQWGDGGGGGGGGAAPAQCAPSVAFLKPAEGRVRDVKTCTSTFFGVTDHTTYVRIASTWPTHETVWVVYGKPEKDKYPCHGGDRWAVFEPQGPARCG